MDFSLIELCVIGVLAILLIGPDELPSVMRGLGRVIKRLQYMKYAVSRQFDEFMYDHELDMMQHNASQSNEGDIQSEMDADVEFGDDFKPEDDPHLSAVEAATPSPKDLDADLETSNAKLQGDHHKKAGEQND